MNSIDFKWLIDCDVILTTGSSFIPQVKQFICRESDWYLVWISAGATYPFLHLLLFLHIHRLPILFLNIFPFLLFPLRSLIFITILLCLHSLFFTVLTLTTVPSGLRQTNKQTNKQNKDLKQIDIRANQQAVLFPQLACLLPIPFKKPPVSSAICWPSSLFVVLFIFPLAYSCCECTG